VSLPRSGRLRPGTAGGAANVEDRTGDRREADTPIKVNSVCPGWPQTDLGGAGNRAAAPTPAAEGAEVVIAMGCLPDDGPTGPFVDRDGPVAW
jgi:hypothetical protein